MRKLIEELKYYDNLYNLGIPAISDMEYDKLYFKLQEMEKETGVVYPDSPTQTIHYEVMNKLSKIEHNHKMLSLQKTKSTVELLDFLGVNNPFLAMCKMDGLTCSLRYVNGELVSAETRGNGLVGEDVTHNARVINNIPKKIAYNDELIVDGEIICTYSDFEEVSSEYKNTRNFASGSIRLLDSTECAKRKLRFVAWDIVKGFEKFSLLTDKLFALSTLGFEVVPFTYQDFNWSIFEEDKAITEETINKMIDFCNNEAELWSYPIDGIVFKFNNIDYGKSLGETSHHFNNAIAFKFTDEIALSRLINIEWSIGREGTLTPIAIFEPVELEGTTCERASLHNLNTMEELLGTPFIGQELAIFKANQIIPQIQYGSKPKEEAVFFSIASTCPICGEKTSIKNGLGSTKELVCENPQCQGKLINRLDYYCSKKGLDIKGLSKATLEKLINQNWLNNISDIYSLYKHKNEWMQLEGFGKKSVENILAAIDESRNPQLENFISALGIPLVGTNVAKELIKHFETYTEFRDAIDNNFDFSILPTFGLEKSKALLNFDYTEADYIINNEINIQKKENKKQANTLEGLNFVITGSLNNFKNRDLFIEFIKQNGGTVSSSVTSKTNYLINNDKESNTSKNKTAKSLGKEILTEEEFLNKFYLTI